MKLRRDTLVCVLLASLLTASCHAFVLPNQSTHRLATPSSHSFSLGPTSLSNQRFGQANNLLHHHLPASLQRQRRSVANVQTMGLFGLGAPEIAIILVAIVFLFGPNQLGNMAGKMAGRVKGEYDSLPDDLKKIPQEFQNGMEESAQNSRARNAKLMEKVPKDEEKDQKS